MSGSSIVVKWIWQPQICHLLLNYC